MLDKNEYEGLTSFERSWIGEMEDGSEVYKGKWKEPREGDPRQFVMVNTIPSGHSKGRRTGEGVLGDLESRGERGTGEVAESVQTT